MSPERYLRLSESIDLHTVDPQHIQVPVTLEMKGMRGGCKRSLSTFSMNVPRIGSIIFE